MQRSIEILKTLLFWPFERSKEALLLVIVAIFLASPLTVFAQPEDSLEVLVKVDTSKKVLIAKGIEGVKAAPSSEVKNVMNYQFPIVNILVEGADFSQYGPNSLNLTTRSAGFGGAVLPGRPSSSLGNVLSDHSSLYVKDYGPGGLATPTLRGTGSGHTQLFWNRLPLNNAAVGLADLSLVSTTMVDYVKVNYGLSSLGWGTGGLGGGINLQSGLNQLSNGPFSYGSVVLSGGSFGSGSIGFKQSYRRGNFIGETRLNLRHSNNTFSYINTARPGFPEEKLENAAYDQGGVMQEFRYQRNRDKFSILFWGSGSQRQLPGTMLSGYQGEAQDDLAIRGMAQWEHYYDEHQVFNQLVVRGGHFWEKNNYEHQVGQIASEARIHSTHLQAETWTRKIWWAHFLRAGVQTSAYHAQSSGFDHTEAQYRIGTFLKSTFPRKDVAPLRTWVTLRHEWVPGVAAPVLGQWGVKWLPLQGKQKETELDLSADIGRNARIPSLNDLYWSPGGNPDLKPEFSWTSEAHLGIRRNIYLNNSQFGFLRLQLGGFTTLADNWIQWIPDNSGFWSAQNVKQVFSRGGEAELKGYLDLGKSAWLNFSGNYTFTRISATRSSQSNDPTIGKQLIYAPWHTGKGNLSFHRKGLEVKWNHQFIGKRAVDPENLQFLSTFQTGNASVGYTFDSGLGNLRIGLLGEVRNVFNEQYQNIAWRPMPGRGYFLTVKFFYQLPIKKI